MGDETEDENNSDEFTIFGYSLSQIVEGISYLGRECVQHGVSTSLPVALIANQAVPPMVRALQRAAVDRDNDRDNADQVVPHVGLAQQRALVNRDNADQNIQHRQPFVEPKHQVVAQQPQQIYQQPYQKGQQFHQPPQQFHKQPNNFTNHPINFTDHLNNFTNHLNKPPQQFHQQPINTIYNLTNNYINNHNRISGCRPTSPTRTIVEPCPSVMCYK